MRATLYQVVVIGIYTGYHVAAQRTVSLIVMLSFLQKVHQHGFLTTREIDFRREHHLEIALVVFKLAEHCAPEIDIIVALDIGHYSAARLLGGERIGRLEITTADIIP